MAARTKARKRALDVLFEADQRGLDPLTVLARRIAEPGTQAPVPQYSVDLVEGVVVVETLFAWPGIGHALVHAIFGRDVPMIQGTALVMGLMFVALNALVDLFCHGIDPRRRST